MPKVAIQSGFSLFKYCIYAVHKWIMVPQRHKALCFLYFRKAYFLPSSYVVVYVIFQIAFFLVSCVIFSYSRTTGLREPLWQFFLVCIHLPAFLAEDILIFTKHWRLRDPNVNLRKITVRKTIWDLECSKDLLQNFLLTCLS